MEFHYWTLRRMTFSVIDLKWFIFSYLNDVVNWGRWLLMYALKNWMLKWSVFFMSHAENYMLSLRRDAASLTPVLKSWFKENDSVQCELIPKDCRNKWTFSNKMFSALWCTLEELSLTKKKLIKEIPFEQVKENLVEEIGQKKERMGRVKKESPLQRIKAINMKLFLKAFYIEARCHSRTSALQWFTMVVPWSWICVQAKNINSVWLQLCNTPLHIIYRGWYTFKSL